MAEPQYKIEPDPAFSGRCRVLRDGNAIYHGHAAECRVWLAKARRRDEQDASVRRIFGYA